MIKTIAVLGAGSWGTAVAMHFAAHGHRVLLWSRDPDHIAHLNANHENRRYLPGLKFPSPLHAEASLTTCTEQSDHVIIAVPSHGFADLLQQLPNTLSGLAWLSKGIDPQTHSLLSELVASRFGSGFPMAIVSGPSFANEVARQLPTALVIAGNHVGYSNSIRDLFSKQSIRTYLSHDLVGVQLCGAIKNVLAIACGVSDGLVFGANAKAALITRGLSEMTRLGSAWGAHQETFVGLAGLGDLVLTCTDNQSRNRRFGLLIGQGMAIDEAETNIKQVVEGRYNAKQISHLAAQVNIELPICQYVHHLIQGTVSAKQAAEELMNRPLP